VPTPDRPPWVVDTLRTVASRVRGRRLDDDLTQFELAERAGVDERTVQRVEAGRYDIKLSYLLRIAHALNVHITDLLA